MDIYEMLAKAKAIAQGHFIYKALYMHGKAYIDKDQLPSVGAQNFVALLEAEAEKALNMGLTISHFKEVALITPAYGAIKLGLPIAAYLERRTGTKIIVLETEVERNAEGKRVHFIPDNQKKRVMGLPVIGAEDIVNKGITLRELRDLVIKDLNSSLFAAICIADRGGQTPKTLGIPHYYPYIRMTMVQYDVRKEECPDCKAGVPISTELGKGIGWVKMFGQPPYPPGMDFSAFWNSAN